MAINQNGGNIVNEVFTTPGDVLYTGGTIYQDDSIFAQASGNTTAYPVPTFGTSTRRLHIVDSAGNTINDVTVGYTASTNKTFSVTGGRTYYVRGYTNFSYPATATLTIMEMYEDIASGFYEFQYYLDDAVDGDFTISANGGISANMYFSGDCTGGSEVTFLNSSSSTVLKGQYGYSSVTTGESTSYGFGSYELQNAVYIDGNFYNHGSTFVKGVTTVTVNIQTNCGGL